jgi:hypothetical protein
MEVKGSESSGGTTPAVSELKNMIRNVIEEYASVERHRAEPAYKAELLDERKRREQLEKRVNELIEETNRARRMAEEADRHSHIRSELQKLGVGKVDLAFKVVKDDIRRSDNGSLVVRGTEGELSLREYLADFVSNNPEFLPARIAGGSGLGSSNQPGSTHPATDLDRIKPGMPAEELQRVREQISQFALQALKGE